MLCLAKLVTRLASLVKARARSLTITLPSVLSMHPIGQRGEDVEGVPADGQCDGHHRMDRYEETEAGNILARDLVM